jgi:hypothetical protein
MTAPRETHDLIESLVADLEPAPPRSVPLRIAATAALGGAMSLGLVLILLGLRPDLPAALGDMMFWMKATYAAVLGLAGFWSAERLARPAGRGRGGLVVVGVALAAVAAIATMRMLRMPPELRMPMWLGQSWDVCPVRILLLSVPTLALALMVMRRMAPTRLRLAGAAAGLFAGGVAAVAYGLHCTEVGAAFLATWYSLGVALSAALGALLGPLALRWR